MRAHEVITEKVLSEMGGQAFKEIEPTRINREDIDPTLKYISDTINHPIVDFNYLKKNLMGSVGKQPTSGDIDVAVDQERIDLSELANHIRKYLDNEQILTKGLKGGQFQTLWPIAGDPEKGFIQVDFIAGNPEWLKFSHHSPGTDVSPYKGVWLSTLLGILAKMRKDFEVYDYDGNRVARVGLYFNLEKGLYRKWKMQLQPGQGLSDVEPDVWETKLGTLMDKGIIPQQKISRFARLGYVDDPEAAVQMLFGKNVKPSDVDTFEKAWQQVKRIYPNRIDEVKERLADGLLRSGLKGSMSEEEIIQKIEEL